MPSPSADTEEISNSSALDLHCNTAAKRVAVLPIVDRLLGGPFGHVAMETDGKTLSASRNEYLGA